MAYIRRIKIPMLTAIRTADQIVTVICRTFLHYTNAEFFGIQIPENGNGIGIRIEIV